MDHLMLGIHSFIQEKFTVFTCVLLENSFDECESTSFALDFKKELRSLNRELQLHLLELADVLVDRPSQYARRVEDVSLIFKNIHHLLNSLRPHQVCYVA